MPDAPLNLPTDKNTNMSDTNALILQGEGYSLLIAPEAQAMKAELLKHSALVVEVRDPESSAAAQSQIKKIAAIRNAVEKCRNEVKRPVLTVGREIDSKAAEYMAELLMAEARLKKLVEDYATEVEKERQRLLREAEEKRRAEEKAAREAEEARLKAEREAQEAARKAEEAMWADDEAEAKKAAEEARKAQEEADRVAKEEAARRAENFSAISVMPEKASGVKFTYDFEVTDIHQLYRYASSLVKLEPKRSDIIEHIKSLPAADPEIPGLRVFKKPIVSTR